MEKSLVLSLGNGPEALGEALDVVRSSGVSILRMSYRRVVDRHAFFLDVSGTISALEALEGRLRAGSLLPGEKSPSEVRKLTFHLADDTSLLFDVLERIAAHADDVGSVDLRDGTLSARELEVMMRIGDGRELDELLWEVRDLCDVEIGRRSRKFGVRDTDSFYFDFADNLAHTLGLTPDDERVILVNANRIMQNLASANANPFSSFEDIDRMARMIKAYRGASYGSAARVTSFETCLGARVTCVEPPIGSDTWVIDCDECYLVVDAGYRCCAAELDRLLAETLPDWGERRHVLVYTHGDMDHVGDPSRFDELWASGRAIDGFMFEETGVFTWRELDAMGYPYYQILKRLVGYVPPAHERMRCLGEESPFGEQEELLRRIDTLEMAPFTFEVWEGKGGHVRGEIALVERAHHLCVAGDIFVNVHEQTKTQALYNALAPSLVTRVDADIDLARRERKALFSMLDAGTWHVLVGHGAPFTYVAT